MNKIHNLSTYFFIQKKYFHVLFYFESLLTYSICTRKEQCHSCFAANDNAFGNNLIATIFNSAVDFRVMIFITNQCRSFKKSSQVCKKNKKTPLLKDLHKSSIILWVRLKRWCKTNLTVLQNQTLRWHSLSLINIILWLFVLINIGKLYV